MKYSATVQIRAYGAKYPCHIFKTIEADTPAIAIVLIWDWAVKLKGSKGPHEVLNVTLT